MKEIKVKEVVIGTGKPKICVPIIATNHVDIINEFKEIKDYEFDLIELRIDFFDEIFNDIKVKQLLSDIRLLKIKKPIIFTYRSTLQGGNITLTNKQYFNLVKLACEANVIDIVDVELVSDKQLIANLVQLIKEANLKVLMSNHNFKSTPKLEEIMTYFETMSQYGDILKFACMPNDPKDVLTLLEATHLASIKYHQPIITMSMSSLGTITRMIGEVFGSAVTFGMLKKASAPGQVDAVELKTVLDIVHKQF